MSGPRSFGLSAREAEIMTFSDAGISKEMIARELGIEPSYVAKIVARYSYAHCWGNSDRFERMVRAGDAAYSRALAATGKRYA